MDDEGYCKLQSNGSLVCKLEPPQQPSVHLQTVDMLELIKIKNTADKCKNTCNDQCSCSESKINQLETLTITKNDDLCEICKIFPLLFVGTIILYLAYK